MYNPKYYINGELWQLSKGKGPAICTFIASDGTVIGMFQGDRGDVIGKILCSENGKEGCRKNGNKDTVKSETTVQ